MSKIITPIILFIVSVGLFFTYIKPAYGTLLKLREQSARLDLAIAESDVLLEKHTDLVKKYNNISDINKKRFKQFLPDALDAVGIIIDMDFLATKHNLNIRTFEVPVMKDVNVGNRNKRKASNNSEDENNPVKSATFTIECDGNYDDFKKFLLDIERDLLLLDMTELNISVSDITEPGAVMETVYSVKLQTYWFK